MGDTPPSDRKTILLGSGLLVLLVATSAVVWYLSNGTSSGTTPATAQPLPSSVELLAGRDNAPDAAGEPITIEHSDPIPMIVYLTPTCGCCVEWVTHIEEYGFDVELNYIDNTRMFEVKEEYGLGPNLASCHTSIANGYVFEGHIPGEVVREFLAEAPPVKGLAVPGMPIGSPGMEMGDRVDPYDVLAFTSDGYTQVYSRQGR